MILYSQAKKLILGFHSYGGEYHFSVWGVNTYARHCLWCWSRFQSVPLIENDSGTPELARDLLTLQSLDVKLV